MSAQGNLNEAQSTYLNFVRAGAAFAVLIGHAAHLFLSDSGVKNSHIQNAGVLVFFILSGFLVSFSVLRNLQNKTYTFKTFFIDRFCRIYCAFIPALFFVKILDSFTLSLPVDSSARVSEITWIRSMQDHQDWLTFFGNLFMLQDFPVFQVLRRMGFKDSPIFIDTFGSGTPFWTISIEWWIYMLFGFIVIVLIRDMKKLNPVVLCLLGLFSIVPFYYAIGGVNNCLTLLWITGMLFAFFFIDLPSLISKRRFLITGNNARWGLAFVFSFSILLMFGRLMAIYFDVGKFAFCELQFGLYLALAIFSGVLFFGFCHKAPIWIDKTFAFLADYSYSLYLVHVPILTYLYIRFPNNDSNSFFFWFAILACNICAILFWFLFERHYRFIALMIKRFTT